MEAANIQSIEIAWRNWFLQFAPFVFTDGELIQDPNNSLYPRITFSYSLTDVFVNSLTTYQVWTYSHNNAELWTVCDKIAEAVPVETGTEIIIPGETYFEYLNPITEFWVEFEITDFQSIADEFAPTAIEWRRVESESAGGINIKRGTPFLTPSPKDEELSRAMYGTLQARYLNII